MDQQSDRQTDQWMYRAIDGSKGLIKRLNSNFYVSFHENNPTNVFSSALLVTVRTSDLDNRCKILSILTDLSFSYGKNEFPMPRGQNLSRSIYHYYRQDWVRLTLLALVLFQFIGSFFTDLPFRQWEILGIILMSLLYTWCETMTFKREAAASN